MSTKGLVAVRGKGMRCCRWQCWNPNWQSWTRSILDWISMHLRIGFHMRTDCTSLQSALKRRNAFLAHSLISCPARNMALSLKRNLMYRFKQQHVEESSGMSLEACSSQRVVGFVAGLLPKDVAEAIQSVRAGSDTRSLLVVTHFDRFLQYVDADYVHVMYKGKIIKSGVLSRTIAARWQ
eukprot:2643479-Amphidinium_carterae.1